MRTKQHTKDIKRPYQKPQLRIIALAAEEVLSNYCQNPSPNATQPPGGCGVNLVCQ